MTGKTIGFMLDGEQVICSRPPDEDYHAANRVHGVLREVVLRDRSDQNQDGIIVKTLVDIPGFEMSPYLDDLVAAGWTIERIRR